MTLAAHATGTLNSSVGSEDFLTSPNVAGTYQLYVDLNAMASGDVVELRVYTIVLTGGTTRVAYFQRFEGAQHADDKIAISVPLSTELAESNGLRFSLYQKEGSTRAFPWKVLKFT